MMRVTFTQINDMVQRNLQNNYANLANLQEQLSSGRRLNRPSDDPIDMKNNINLKSEVDQGNQYERNIEDGVSWISMTEVAMTDMNEILQRSRELAVSADNDTMTATDRQYVADEIEQLIKQFANLANSSYKGNYIFGGTNGNKQVYEFVEQQTYSFGGTSGNPPMNGGGTANTMVEYANHRTYQYKRLQPGSVSVVIDPSGAATPAVEGTDYEVDYALGTITVVAGSALDTAVPAQEIEVTFDHYNKKNRDTSGQIKREIADGVKPVVNITADEIFESSSGNLDTIGSLIRLLDGLRSNDGNKISSSITGLDTTFEMIRSAQSKNGALLNRFELTLERNENRNIEMTRLQSELEDLDFAEAIMQFSLTENVYNASLRAGAKVIMPTLGDFI